MWNPIQKLQNTIQNFEKQAFKSVEYSSKSEKSNLKRQKKHIRNCQI